MQRLEARDGRIYEQLRSLKKAAAKNRPEGLSYTDSKAKVSGPSSKLFLNFHQFLTHMSIEFAEHPVLRESISNALRARGLNQEDLLTLEEIIPEGLDVNISVNGMAETFFRERNRFAFWLDSETIDMADVTYEDLVDFYKDNMKVLKLASFDWASTVLLPLSQHGRMVLMNYIQEKYESIPSTYDLNTSPSDLEIENLRKGIELKNKKFVDKER
jgi:hypothetical protein